MPEPQYQQAAQAIRAGYFNRDAYRRRDRQILVLETGLAGMRYHLSALSEEDEALLKSLEPGTELRLCREPENEHDSWAIAVTTLDGRMLGHISRFKNETIARLMDEGRRFTASVIEPIATGRPRAPTEDFSLSIAVYMAEGMF